MYEYKCTIVRVVGGDKDRPKPKKKDEKDEEHLKNRGLVKPHEVFNENFGIHNFL